MKIWVLVSVYPWVLGLWVPWVLLGSLVSGFLDLRSTERTSTRYGTNQHMVSKPWHLRTLTLTNQQMVSKPWNLRTQICNSIAQYSFFPHLINLLLRWILTLIKGNDVHLFRVNITLVTWAPILKWIYKEGNKEEEKRKKKGENEKLYFSPLFIKFVTSKKSDVFTWIVQTNW